MELVSGRVSPIPITHKLFVGTSGKVGNYGELFGEVMDPDFSENHGNNSCRCNRRRIVLGVSTCYMYKIIVLW